MKKRVLAAIAAAVFLFSLTGCGQWEEWDAPTEAKSEPVASEKMELTNKKLTEAEKTTIGMAGVDIRNSTGILLYNAGKKVKSVNIKIMEYTEESGKWKKAAQVVPFRTDVDGKLLVLYEDEGTRARTAVAYKEKGFSFSETKGLDAFPSKNVTATSSVKTPVPIVLNEEIAVHMIVEGKTDDKSIGAPALKDYPDVSNYQDYKRVRAVVVTFSDNEN